MTFIKKLVPEAIVRRCSGKKVFFKDFVKLIGKHLRQSLYLNNVTGLRPTILLKKSFRYRSFLVRFLRTPFIYRTPFLVASVIHTYLLFWNSFAMLGNIPVVTLSLLWNILEIIICQHWLFCFACFICSEPIVWRGLQKKQLRKML